MDIRDYDIHGIVRVQVESSIPAKIAQLAHHLAEFEVSHNPDTTPDIEILDYDAAAPMAASVVISATDSFVDGVLDLPGERLRLDLRTPRFRIHCDHFTLPVNFLVQLALLPKGYSFVHAAAVSYHGRNFLFPAFGGIGKTTLVGAVVADGGKLYGDDLCIVGRGRVFSYPQDFSVYPYHLEALSFHDRSVRRAFRRTAALDALLKPLARFETRPAKLVKLILGSFRTPVVNVPPRTLFGGDCVADEGDIDEVLYLYRTGDRAGGIAIEPANAIDLAATATETLLHEVWSGAAQHHLLYGALTEPVLPGLYADVRSVFEDTFGSAPCQSVAIPRFMANITYQQEMLSLLQARVL